MSSISKDLLLAYKNTDYVVYASPNFTLHISEYSVPFLKLANTQDSKQAVFITAHNPYSCVKTPSQNKAAQNQLRAEIIKNGWRYFEGIGQSKDLSWKEESFLVFGIDRLRAQNLCERYDQQAVVWIDEHATPELIFSSLRKNSV